MLLKYMTKFWKVFEDQNKIRTPTTTTFKKRISEEKRMCMIIEWQVSTKILGYGLFLIEIKTVGSLQISKSWSVQ